jgi:antitoxin component of RelBE/YafQ-DinJ toxin-antitoxin module
MSKIFGIYSQKPTNGIDWPLPDDTLATKGFAMPYFSMRIDDRTKKSIKTAAKRLGMTTSTYLLSCHRLFITATDEQRRMAIETRDESLDSLEVASAQKTQ